MTIWKSSSGITARSRRHNHLALCPEHRYDPFHDHLAFDSQPRFPSPRERHSRADLSSSGASFLCLCCCSLYFRSTTIKRLSNISPPPIHSIAEEHPRASASSGYRASSSLCNNQGKGKSEAYSQRVREITLSRYGLNIKLTGYEFPQKEKKNRLSIKNVGVGWLTG